MALLYLSHRSAISDRINGVAVFQPGRRRQDECVAVCPGATAAACCQTRCVQNTALPGHLCARTSKLRIFVMRHSCVSFPDVRSVFMKRPNS